jgi:hypothetical protein
MQVYKAYQMLSYQFQAMRLFTFRLHPMFLQALWVLGHELGHALHLALSSSRCSFGVENGLQLPLEALEVGVVGCTAVTGVHRPFLDALSLCCTAGTQRLWLEMSMLRLPLRVAVG